MKIKWNVVGVHENSWAECDSALGLWSIDYRPYEKPTEWELYLAPYLTEHRCRIGTFGSEDQAKGYTVFYLAEIAARFSEIDDE